MKQILFSLLVMVAFNVNAQKAKTTTAKNAADVKKQEVVQQAAPAETAEFVMAKSKAKMSFESLTVDYGTIEYGSEPLRIAKFTNTGTEPLVINNARGSCGCTVPKWPTEPIAPGQSANLEIRYDTNRPGRISKSVTVSTNEGEDHVLQVVGEVLPKKEETPVPPAQPNIIKGN
ncbi:MAG: DUF1573 domain-containing protein [Saprospiraceae bacterium]|jgi:hypothetical protein